MLGRPEVPRLDAWDRGGIGGSVRARGARGRCGQVRGPGSAEPAPKAEGRRGPRALLCCEPGPDKTAGWVQGVRRRPWRELCPRGEARPALEAWSRGPGDDWAVHIGPFRGDPKEDRVSRSVGPAVNWR
ncbi:hypothetical protein NDU88_007060 [Pleurodeles waltl]|uniref:Uncharacterized protein n=1 Tax=Pleurodeles waltl TaxID=8319 RepID=A0AAV7QKW9_PLEWA|nr:hypothetical protein NDU88_007060 [Pleurodeles waltl]